MSGKTVFIKRIARYALAAVLWVLLLFSSGFPGEGTEKGPAIVNNTPVLKTVAVFDFIQEGPKGSNAAPDLPELIGILFLDSFQGRETVTIVERKKLAEVMAELRLGTSSIVDMNTRLRLGRFLGADYFVFGSYLQAGDQLLISAHLVSVESGMIIKASDADGPRTQVAETVRRLATKLIVGLDRGSGG